MSGFQPVVMPDFGATYQRGVALADQRESNALARMMQQRQLEQQQQFENVLAKPAVAQGLMSADPAVRSAAVAALGTHGGTHGFQMAMPMMQQERQDAINQRVYAMPGAPGVPAVNGQPAPAAAPAAPANVPPELMPHFIAASQETGIPVPVLLAVARQESDFGRGRDRPGDGVGVMQVLRSTAANPGYGLVAVDPATLTDPAANIRFGARYLRARAGAGTDFSDPVQRARALAAYNGGGDPNYVQNVSRYLPGATAAGAPSGPPSGGIAGAPSLQWVSAAMRSGNPAAQREAAAWLPIITRDPNIQMTEVDGRRLAIRNGDTSNPIDLGRAGDPNGPVPAGMRRTADGGLERVPGAPQENEDQQRGFENTRQIRTEFAQSQAAKDYNMVLPQFRALRAAERTDSRAADIDMVFAFAKMLDPNSVVREGEQLQLMRTGGVFDTVQGWVNGLAGGQRLTPEVRAAIVAQADSRMGTFRDAYGQQLEYYRDIARSSGFNPDHVGREPDPIQGRQAAAPPAVTPQVRQSAQQAIAAARGQLGPGASDEAVIARARELLGR